MLRIQQQGHKMYSTITIPVQYLQIQIIWWHSKKVKTFVVAAAALFYELSEEGRAGFSPYPVDREPISHSIFLIKGIFVAAHFAH